MIPLNHKDRVRRAIQHHPVDRVPKGELCVDDRVIGAFLGVESVIHEHRRTFAEGMGMDLWCLPVQYPEPVSPEKFPLPDQADWRELERWTRDTDFYTFILIDGAFGWGVRRWGFESFVLKVVRNDPDVPALNREIETFNLGLIERAADRGAAGVVLADDIAYQNGLIIAPEMLRNSFFPSLERQVDRIKSLGLQAFFHSDGNLDQVMDDIPGIGFDGLQCIEEAAGMDLKKVKQRYGSRICLWGNLDPVFMIESLDPGTIEAKVRDVVEVGSPNSGFIFGTSSGLFQWVRPDLVQQAYRAVETSYRAPGD